MDVNLPHLQNLMREHFGDKTSDLVIKSVLVVVVAGICGTGVSIVIGTCLLLWHFIFSPIKDIITSGVFTTADLVYAVAYVGLVTVVSLAAFAFGKWATDRFSKRLDAQQQEIDDAYDRHDLIFRNHEELHDKLMLAWEDFFERRDSLLDNTAQLLEQIRIEPSAVPLIANRDEERQKDEEVYREGRDVMPDDLLLDDSGD